MKRFPLALSVISEKRCEVLACFHVVVKMYWYSLEEWVFIVKTYWITGSINHWQRRFVEQFGGRNPPTDWQCEQQAGCVDVSFCLYYLYLYLILASRVANFLFANSQNTSALHYRYNMQMYCTFVLFVIQHFPGLPASGTHCIYDVLLNWSFWKGELVMELLHFGNCWTELSLP
jgi:hypothetical protein